MGIEQHAFGRRELLVLAALGVIPGPAASATAPLPPLLASWEHEDGSYRVGLLRHVGGRLLAGDQVAVPTRAHGLLPLHADWLLAVARRPGDWLLRWAPSTGSAQWTWAEPDRVFTGHAVHDAQANRIYTGETDLGSGQGLIGVRDPVSLEKLAEWPTHGRDPHQFLLDGAGALMVANGGIQTRPGSGRRKLSPGHMDASLVRLAPGNGELLGEWRLPDRRLSLRHLAWGHGRTGPVLGIALQAEHDTPAQKDAAPVLALFDGFAVREVESAAGLRGYAGDIAWTGRHFVLSAPRAGVIASFDPAGAPTGRQALEQACALASQQGMLLAAGAGDAIAAGNRLAIEGAGRIDNHWTMLGA